MPDGEIGLPVPLPTGFELPDAVGYEGWVPDGEMGLPVPEPAGFEVPEPVG